VLNLRILSQTHKLSINAELVFALAFALGFQRSA